ncbi:hypothetical protein [Embleya sp. MST-111070]|uniref:hypothetical protein n=1 Tax=Embleya sp. MST-111070 TaxID=3398231 RepID=UPI003F739B24
MAAIPLDLLDRIRELERQVRELTGRAQMRPALNEILHGDVKIGEGGQILVYPPGSTRPVFGVGQWSDGSWGMETRRQDGSLALTIEGSSYGEGDADGMVRLWNRDQVFGEVLVMDDAYSDRFLGRPWMPWGMYPVRMQSTTRDYELAWWGKSRVHNAVSVFEVWTLAAAGGRVRLTMAINGAERQTVKEWDVAANTWWGEFITHPMHGTQYLDVVEWNIEHQCPSGSVETRLISAYGRNTFSADEAPSPPTVPPTGRSTVAESDPEPAAAPDEAPAPGLRRIDD